MSLMHKVQVTPLIGLPQYDGWSQVTTNDDNSLTVAMAVGGVNAGNVGRDLIGAISQARPQTAAELHSLILDLLHQATTIGSQLALAASCIHGDRTMFAAYQGAVLLKRGEKVGVVVNAPDSVKVLEGKHTVDDVIVLATSQAVTYLGEIQQKVSQGFDTDTIVTSVVPALHSTPNSALTCLAFISFEDQVVETVEKPLIEIELETIPDSLPLIINPEELPALSTDIPLATTPETTTPHRLPSLPVEIAISSASTTAFQERLKPQVATLQRFTTRLKKLVVQLVRATPGVVHRVKRWLQPLFSSGEYLTSLPKKKVLQISIALLVISSLVGGGLLVWRQQMNAQVQAAEIVLQPLTARFEVAQKTITSDPLTARSEMEKVVDEMQVVKANFSQQPAAANFIDEKLQATKQIMIDLSGRAEITSLPVFLDLRALQSDILINDADADATRAALLDTEKKQLILLDLASKQTQAVAVTSLPKVTHLSLAAQRAVILGSGIHEVAVGDPTAGVKQLIEEGDSNREALLIGTFGQYVYVVNPAKRNIFRYAPDGESYTEPIGWLKPGQSLPYDQLTSLAIDGDVWLGTREGEIIKLTQGSAQSFEIKGLPQAFTGPLMVYTKENVSRLYVLEPAAKRLVILQKNGEFVREVKSDSLAAASAVIADETLGMAIVINGSLLFEIKL
jgi:hypothetical protein